MRAGDQMSNLAPDKVPSPSALFLCEVTTPRRPARPSLLCCMLQDCFQFFVRKQRRPRRLIPFSALMPLSFSHVARRQRFTNASFA